MFEYRKIYFKIHPELPNQYQICYNYFPDSIDTGKMLQDYSINYQKRRKLLMAQQPYVFAQFLSLISRYEFQRIVNKYNGDFHTKTFKCWHQLGCMIFAHVRQENSLRDIDIALNAHAKKLYHIGIQQCPKSTLADANEKRDCRMRPGAPAFCRFTILLSAFDSAWRY